MKKTVLLTIFLLIGSLYAKAQDYETLFSNLENEIPIDPTVRKGVLDNGMTYYVKKNSKPENRLTLRLVVNAGWLLEADDQNGLAHFVEHMCFNGTKNFEKNDIVKYLQSIGVKFGADLNAYTSFDETVYFLPIPTDNDTIVENGFQIMEDWAHNVTFDKEEVDKERGVIVEEMRLRNNANLRMANEYIPVLLNNPVYEDILNSVKEAESIKTFQYESLTKYYEDWYRPELMAIIAVGDLDPDLIEKKIKEHFNRIPKSKKGPKRKIFEIPDQEGTAVKVVSDKEATNTSVQVYYKTDPFRIKTLNDYKLSLIHNLYSGMLNIRLRELTQQPDPPFIFAGGDFGGTYNRNKDAFSVYAGVSETGIERGLHAVMTESERVKQHGFTAGELVRYKLELLKGYEKAYNERGKTESKSYVDEYQGNFLVQEVIPGIEFEYAFAAHIMDQITLEDVNAMSSQFISEDNRVIIVSAPEREGLALPSEAQLKAVVDEVGTVKLDPYVDKVSGAALLAALPKAGAIVKETTNETTGVTYLELSNGVKVALKPTDFKNDEIIFTAYADGGTSAYPDDVAKSAEFSDAIVQGCGYGGYSPSDLQKILAGKVASVSPFVSDLQQGLNGSCTPKDAETMFQLIHLAFTEPNQNEDLYNAYLSRLKAYFKNVLENPINYFYNERIKFLTQDHPRSGGYPTEEDFEKVEFEKAFSIYKELFSNASQFNFVFVGNFKVEEFKKYLEQYVASLPTSDKSLAWKDLGIRPPKGDVAKDVYRGNDPKSMVYIYFHNDFEFDRKTNYHLNSLAEALNIKLIEILREDQSGVYSTGAFAQTSKFPYENYNLIVYFPCAPENVENLINSAYGEINKIKENGVLEEDMVKVKETQRREMEVNLKENSFWRSIIKNSLMYDWDLEDILDYEARIKGLNAKELQEAAKKYFDFGSKAEVVLYPESEKKE